MCQLTLINGKNKTLNKNFLKLLLYNNSLDNLDGTGLFSFDAKMFIKSKIPAFNWQNEIEKFLVEYPSKLIVAHVRSASTNKTKIEDKFAHPFKTDKYLVFHNGTFEKMTVSSDTTDTFEFAKLLTENYTGDIVKDFNNVYKGGKFALIIYDMELKKLFILRGATAFLHKTTIEINGEKLFLINTEENTIIRTINQLNLAGDLFGIKNNIKIGNIELLDENSAFEFNPNKNELIKIGEVKETKSSVENVYGYNTIYGTGYDYSSSDPSPIINKLKSFGITFEIDLLLKENHDKLLSDYASTTILEDLYEKLKPFYSNEKAKIWKDILKKNSDLFLLDIYRKFKLTVPYFFNSTEQLKKCI